VLGALVISSCETGTTTAGRTLPSYEARLAKTDFQNVRTTAYTHTESDHTQYGARNALGGELHAAGPAIHRAENVMSARAISDSEESDIRPVSNTSTTLQPFSTEEKRTTTTTTTRVTKKAKGGSKRAIAVAKKPPKIGSAAADWGRWPAGTTFRLISTGQIYRVDDYGWALSGRNTIDLYMATSRDMNTWGARQEPIQVLQWGDSAESLRLLAPHQQHPHVKRMMLEIEGREQEAAALQ
jgi:3D (Asp-Asp-Asp) domain-containing protein